MIGPELAGDHLFAKDVVSLIDRAYERAIERLDTGDTSQQSRTVRWNLASALIEIAQSGERNELLLIERGLIRAGHMT